MGPVAISTSNGEVAGTIGGQAVSHAAGPRHPLPKICASPCVRRRSTTSTASPRPRSRRGSGVSRPTAGRLVARAKAKGLVRIEVVVPPDMRDDLHADEERELEQRFGLTEAVVAGHGIDVGAPGGPRRSPASAGPRRHC